MKLYTAILAASLFMYVGVRNGTGDRISNDSLPRVDKFIGLLIGNWSHPYKRSHLSETMTGWRNADTVFECVIHSDNKILATRDTTGKWKVYNASKALEMFYQSHMEMFNKVYPEPKEPEFHIQLNAKPSPSPLPDTIPKYRYIFKLELSAEMLDRILYVQDSLMTHWGVEKGTTESNNAKLLYFNYSNYIRRSLKLDSVKIEQKGGGK